MSELDHNFVDIDLVTDSDRAWTIIVHVFVDWRLIDFGVASLHLHSNHLSLSKSGLQ